MLTTECDKQKLKFLKILFLHNLVCKHSHEETEDSKFNDLILEPPGNSYISTLQ